MREELKKMIMILCVGILITSSMTIFPSRKAKVSYLSVTITTGGPSNIVPISAGTSVTIYERTSTLLEHTFSVQQVINGDATFSTTAAEEYTISSDGTYLLVECYRPSYVAVGNNIAGIKLNGVENHPEGIWVSVVISYSLGIDGREESVYNITGNDLSTFTRLGNGYSNITVGFSYEGGDDKGNILVYSTYDGYGIQGDYSKSLFDDTLPTILGIYGYSVTLTDRMESPEITDTLLSDYDELWLLSTDYDTGGCFSQAEIDAILNFRNGGGGLLIMADHTDYSKSFAFDANQISTELGVTFYGRVYHGSGNPIAPTFENHPLFQGVDTIYGHTSEGIISVDNPDVDVVATYNGDNLIAILDDDLGRVVFDASFMRLGDGRLELGDTIQYVKNIADWLMRSSGLPVASFTYSPSNPTIGETITFYTSGSYDPDGYLTGYRWDWENDGIWDTNWSRNKIAYHKYEIEGIYTPKLQVKDADGLLAEESKIISVGKNYKELAMHWAPVIYQDTDSNDYLADYITSFDFDGDWRGDNNWENKDRYPLKAYVYYWLTETPTHYFIGYAIYHPRDWKVIGSHENDMEGILIVVKKDGMPYGKFLCILTLYHLTFHAYNDSDSYPSNTLVGGEGDVEFWNGHHPIIYIEARGHGIKGDLRWEINDFPNGDGVVYYPTGSTGEPSNGNDRNVGYDLKSINELWSRKFDYLYTFERWGIFNSPSDSLKAEAPWIWGDTFNPVVKKGDIFFNPAYFTDVYFDGLGEYSYNYVSFSFKNKIDLYQLIKSYKPIIYTTTFSDEYERVFTPHEDVKINVVLANPTFNEVEGKITLKIYDTYEETYIETIARDYEIILNPFETKRYTWIWNTQDYANWKSSGFNFTGKKLNIDLVVDDKTFRYGFFVDEFGIPKWLRGVRWVQVAGEFSKILAKVLNCKNCSNKKEELKEEFKELLQNVTEMGFNAIFIGAEYYMFDDLCEANQPWPHVNYWFPANHEGTAHYTTPNQRLMDIVNWSKSEARELIRELADEAWNNYQIRVSAYTDPMAIYSPDRKGKGLLNAIYYEHFKNYDYVPSAHKHAEEKGWARMDEQGKSIRANFIENTIQEITGIFRRPTIQHLAVEVDPTGNSTSGRANDDNGFMPKQIKIDIQNGKDDDTSYHHHICAQFYKIEDYYDFEGIMVDDIGRLIMTINPFSPDTLFLGPTKPSGSFYGNNFSPTANYLREKYGADIDTFDMDSMANMLKHLRWQLKHFGNDKILISSNYFSPSDVNWKSLFGVYDVDNSDQFNILSEAFARWAYKDFNETYKPIRTDYRKSEAYGEIHHNLNKEKFRGALTAIAWANRVNIEGSYGVFKDSEYLQKYIKMQKKLEEKGIPVFDTWQSQDMIYNSKLPELNSRELIISPTDIYGVAYRLPCEFGEKYRIAHLVNLSGATSNIVIKTKLPPNEYIKSIKIISPDIDIYINNITDSYGTNWWIKNGYVIVNLNIDVYSIILIEFGSWEEKGIESVVISQLDNNGLPQQIQQDFIEGIKEGAEIIWEFTLTAATTGLNIILNWFGSDLDIHLYSPTGEHIGMNYINDEIEKFGNATYISLPAQEIISVEDPEPGNWTVKIYGKEISEEFNQTGEPFQLFIYSQGDYKPSINISIAYHEIAVKNQTYDFNVNITNIGIGTAYNATLRFSAGSVIFAQNNISVGKIENNVTFSFDIMAIPMEDKKQTINITLTYQDANGTQYEKNRVFEINVIEQPHLFLSIETIPILPTENHIFTIVWNITNFESIAKNITLNISFDENPILLNTTSVFIESIEGKEYTLYEIKAVGTTGIHNLTVNISYEDEQCHSYIFKNIFQIMIVEDTPPFIEIISPKNNTIVHNTIEINGLAWDINGNETLQKVEIKIDDGEWMIVNGATIWNYNLDTTLFSNGIHYICARAYDGKNYSEIASVQIEINNKKSQGIPGFQFVGLLSIAIMLFLIERRKRYISTQIRTSNN